MAWLFRMSVGYERKQEAEEKKGHCLQALRKHTQERRELSLRYESCSVYSRNTLIKIPNTSLRSKHDFLHILKSGVPLQLEELLCTTGWEGGNLAGRIQVRQLPHADAQKPHDKILQGGGMYQTVRCIPLIPTLFIPCTSLSADHLFPRKTLTVIFFTDLFLQNWHYFMQ